MVRKMNVRVVPGSGRNLIKEENGALKVYLTKPAQGGLANAQLVELLADYFKVKKYQLSIIKGEKTRNKVICISCG